MTIIALVLLGIGSTMVYSGRRSSRRRSLQP
jgi:hypothetical protein